MKTTTQQRRKIRFGVNEHGGPEVSLEPGMNPVFGPDPVLSAVPAAGGSFTKPGAYIWIGGEGCFATLPVWKLLAFADELRARG